MGADMIKPGDAVIDIDININQVEFDGETKIVGDVDTDAVAEVAGWLTPGSRRCWAGDGRDPPAQRDRCP